MTSIRKYCPGLVRFGKGERAGSWVVELGRGLLGKQDPAVGQQSSRQPVFTHSVAEIASDGHERTGKRIIEFSARNAHSPVVSPIAARNQNPPACKQDCCMYKPCVHHVARRGEGATGGIV